METLPRTRPQRNRVRDRLAAVAPERLHVGLMLMLTFTTGVIDAVGYLGLDKVFTGNMTGNVVILGMALGGAQGLPIVGPALALLGFMLGAALGGRVLRHTVGAWAPQTAWLFAVVAGVTIALGFVLLLADEPPTDGLQIAVTTLLGAAMGIQAAAARVVAVKDVTTVVVTSTITGLAADSRLGGRKGGLGGRRALAVVLILVGAIAGAALLQWSLGAALLVPGFLILAVTLLGAAHHRVSDRASSRA